MTDNWVTVSHKKPLKAEKTTPQVVTPSVNTAPSWYDTETVVLRKNIKTTMRVEKATAPNTKWDQSQSQYQRQVEDDAEEGYMKKKSFPETFRTKVLSTRQSMGLNQRDFAQKFNVSEGIIKTIENRTANYDPGLMTRLNNKMNQLTQQKQTQLKNQPAPPQKQ